VIETIVSGILVAGLTVAWTALSVSLALIAWTDYQDGKCQCRKGKHGEQQ